MMLSAYPGWPYYLPIFPSPVCADAPVWLQHSACCCPIHSIQHPEYKFWGMDVSSISNVLTLSWVNYVKRVKKEYTELLILIGG